jgi:integrase
MREKLNAEFVRKLPKANVDIWDTKYPGLVLRCRASGTHTYRVSYGRGMWITLGRADTLTPDEARVKARDELNKIDKGHDPKAARIAAKADVTFGEYLDTHYAPWMLAHRPRTTVIERLKSSAFVEFQDMKLSEFTGFQIERWRSARLKAGITAGTCNRDLGALKSALRRAAIWLLLKRNPLSEVKDLRVDARSIVRYLTKDEEQRLRAALTARDDKRTAKRQAANDWRRERGYREWPADNPDHLTAIVLVALNTGLRQGEIFNLRWTDVDLVGAQLTVRGEGAKSGQTRHVPLNTEAASVLRGRRTGTTGDGYVFPGRTDSGDGRLDNVKKGWLALVKAATITEFRFHDLRHTFASKLVMAGVDLNTVRELLGHSDLKMTLRYSHLSPDHKAAAVAKLVAHGA